MNTIKARINGGPDAMGPVKKFEIMETLPEEGELLDMWDPGYKWGTPEMINLDPEQPDHGEATSNYDFYRVPEIETETDEEAMIHYIAIPLPTMDELEEDEEDE